jgi:flagellar protein FliO/FliZ
VVEVIGRMMLALGVVLAIMWLLAKWARKPLTGKSDKAMTVLARQQLGRGASVAVIRIADRALVLGVTEQNVQLLTEADLAAVETALTVVESTSPRRLPQSLRGRSQKPALQYESVADELDLEFEAEFGPIEPNLAGQSAEIEVVTAQQYVAARTSHRAAKAKPRSSAVETKPGRPSKTSALDGSILSPTVWKSLVQGARDLTVRR